MCRVVFQAIKESITDFIKKVVAQYRVAYGYT